MRLTSLHRTPQHMVSYQVTDLLHEGRMTEVSADQIADIVSAWLAELEVERTPLTEDLARAVSAGDWATVHSLGAYLCVDVAMAV